MPGSGRLDLLAAVLPFPAQAAALPALGDVLAVEAQAQARLGLTADHRDAVQAFLAKRSSEFHGH